MQVCGIKCSYAVSDCFSDTCNVAFEKEILRLGKYGIIYSV